MCTFDGVQTGDNVTSQQLPFLSNYFEEDLNHNQSEVNISPEKLGELSSHPVHLTNRDNMTMPSAFIPFCAYKTSLTAMGDYVDKIKFPICNKFKPILMDGELCYTVNMASFTSEEVKSG